MKHYDTTFFCDKKGPVAHVRIDASLTYPLTLIINDTDENDFNKPSITFFIPNIEQLRIFVDSVRSCYREALTANLEPILCSVCQRPLVDIRDNRGLCPECENNV